jgi:Fe-S oxidoreductase
LERVLSLDSIARCEGETTLVELVGCLFEGRDWHHIKGICYRDGEIVETDRRMLVADIDDLPWPVRSGDGPAIIGRRTAPLLASRGCARDCSFCSIRQFYRQADGRKVRVRDPKKVVEEMRFLRHDHDISVFLFQDDDFPLGRSGGRHWVEQFVEALHSAELIGRVIWKISCRADEVEPDLFALMRDSGLYTVYLGLESGNAAGLETLNKGLRVADGIRATGILKDLDLFPCYGFMMFDPSSTFESIEENVRFLEQVTGDGATPAVFCRMLPYAGTPIEASLIAQGRLCGDVEDPDYDFLDASMSLFFDTVNSMTADWLHGPHALATQLMWAWQEYWVLRRLFPPLPGMDAYGRVVRSLTANSNRYLLDLVRTVASAHKDGVGDIPSVAQVRATSSSIQDRLLSERDEFVRLNQTIILGAL